ncbi:protein trichome birefringence-like 4 [Abrus precatorius]|uniref:Protein trichome birefringence-like 4 n=1 Tax=Abrus precatorius TaxID=3816 RepID=A0A8B8MN91_ABRPR|nr:protein trichome birefringence-like 4 [Abrus precatorius]
MVPKYILGYAVVIAFTVLFFLICGYFLSSHDKPKYWHWMNKISTTTYLYEGLLMNQYQINDTSGKVGGIPIADFDILKRFHIGVDEYKMTNVLIMFGWAVSESSFKEENYTICSTTNAKGSSSQAISSYSRNSNAPNAATLVSLFPFSLSYWLAHRPVSFSNSHVVPKKAHSKGTFSSVTAAKRTHDNSTYKDSQVIKDLTSCDIFDGTWVHDDAEPLYQHGSCPFLDDTFNCFKNGRSDLDYVKYRWKPRGCHIPRFDGLQMLAMLRGKRVVFVGDSLNRNMWQSLVCALRESLEDKSKLYEVSVRRQFRSQGFFSFKFKDYGCSIDFVKSPYLVQEWKNSRKGAVQRETLRLDMIQASKSQYHDADIIIFNTGHWWNHDKTRNGRNYFQEGNQVYDRLQVSEALRKALKTWAKWVDSNVDSKRTRVFFTGFSASHYRGGQWNSGGKCDGEREPITNESYLGAYPWTMRMVESVIAEMKTPVFYLNITKMTDYRKDGHPSVYREAGYNKGLRMVLPPQDCSHWCLPGIPDSWNQLLYATLLIAHQNFLITQI